MAYIGKLPATQGKDAGPSLKIDDISSNFNGQNTVFNLTVDGTSIDPHINNIQIYLSGVHQLPGSSFSLSGSQVVFTQAPSASLSFHGSIIGDARLMTPDNDTVEPASFTSSTSTSISGSLGANATLIRSLTAASISGSKNAGAISGSFRGELSSSVYLRQVASTISGSIPQALATTSSPTFAAGTITGDLSVGGTLTVQEVHTEFESASILFTSGSTRFGDDTTDTHRVTGSMDISGSLKLPHGDVTITDNLDVDGTTNLDVVDIDGAVDMASTLAVGGNITLSKTANNTSAKLQVQGDFNNTTIQGASGNAGGLIVLRNSDTTDNNFSAINFQDANENTLSGILGVNKSHSSNQGEIVFFVRGDLHTDGDEAMRITHGGKVCIGTTTEDAFVNINSGAANAGLHVESTDSNANISMADNAGSVVIAAAGNEFIVETGGTASTAGSGAGEAFRIDDQGLVGIGTNDPKGGGLHIHRDSYPQLIIDGEDNNDNVGFVLSGSSARGGLRWNASNNDVEILREGGGVEISLLDGGGTEFAGNLKINRDADGGNAVLTIQNSAGAGSTDETAQLVFNHTSNNTLGAKIVSIRNDNYNTSGNQSSDLFFTLQRQGSAITPIKFNANNSLFEINQDHNHGVFYIDTESTDQDVFFMDTELTSGKAFHLDVDAITNGMIMDINSNHDDSTTRTLVAIINDSSGATGATPFFVRQDANNRTVAFESARGDLSNDILRMNALGRSSTNNFSFLVTFTDGDDDFQHAMKGDGTIVADGAYDSSGADYAEYFESKDGSAISVGTTVRLDGDKIVSCSIGDTPIGVIRPKNSSATVGNTATFRWAEKYLKDDYGGFQMEQHTITTWDVSGSEDATGGIVTIQHHTDRIPSDVTVPSDAEIISTEEDGSPLMRRKLNPKYTSSLTYVSREDRDEWNIVGLLGQIPITKGQPTGSQWVKMRDISDTVELWYVK